MSDTFSLEAELKRLGEKLVAEGFQLQEAADLLRHTREVTASRLSYADWVEQTIEGKRWVLRRHTTSRNSNG